MTQNEIRIWLQGKRRRGMWAAGWYAAATLSGGAFVLGLTFCFIFVAAKAPLLSAFPLSPWVTPTSTLLAVVISSLIFADSIRSRRDDMSFLPAWLLREYISIGPRLILEGLPHVKRTRQFARMDLELCSKVLAFLAAKSVPTRQKELLKALPEVDWSILASQLGLLEGVIFFRPDGLRVVLTLPLRLELRRLLAQSQSAEIPEPEPAVAAVDEPHRLSPAEILGIAPTATLAQIKSAYRSRVKECHPDRFAGMDERSRWLAEEWTKSLNAAYELLVTQARSQNQI